MFPLKSNTYAIYNLSHSHLNTLNSFVRHCKTSVHSTGILEVTLASEADVIQENNFTMVLQLWLALSDRFNLKS